MQGNYTAPLRSRILYVICTISKLYSTVYKLLANTTPPSIAYSKHNSYLNFKFVILGKILQGL